MQSSRHHQSLSAPAGPMEQCAETVPLRPRPGPSSFVDTADDGTTGWSIAAQPETR
jgi:hypothetical protein